MKKNEIFVAQSLVKYLEKAKKDASFIEGEDPPDAYIEFDCRKIPVEISILDENTLNNRSTVAMGYSAQIKQLNKELSEIETAGVKVVVSIFHGGTKAGRIKKQFAKFLYEIIEDREVETGRYETEIKNVVFRATKYKTESGKVEVAALISPNDKSGKKKTNPFESHIPSRLASIIYERVKVKESKCKNICGPKWLALYDNYINKFADMNDTEHTDTYKEAMDLIEDNMDFEKIFVVFHNAQVLELK